MTDVRLHGEFVDGARGRLFSVSWRGSGAVRGCVLVVPPFGDEMNKSRHLLAQVARELAARGVVAVLPDLYGSGDSDGEFEQATWDGWIEDLLVIGRRLGVQGRPPDRLLAVRSGAALALAAARAAGWPVRQTVLWQPVVDGGRFLTQLLRVKVAASLSAARRESVDDLRQRLRAGETVEVGGYPVASALAGQLDAVRLAPLLTAGGDRLLWIEVSAAGGDGLPPAAAALVREAQQAGIGIEPLVVAGAPFWSAAELVPAPELVAITARTLGALP